MILPIVAYGTKILKTKAKEVNIADKTIPELIENMFETMYNAEGIGLAAPQIGVSKRIFVVDATPVINKQDTKEEDKIVFKKAFINAEMVSQSGDEWAYEEGCLSIPNINISVMRQTEIEIKHQKMDGRWIIEKHIGLIARIIQHEYDHIEGRLFTDYSSPLKKRLLKNKLKKIASGNIKTKYPMKFPV